MRHLFWGGVHPAGRKELSRGAAPTPPPFQARSSPNGSAHRQALYPSGQGMESREAGPESRQMPKA